MTASTTSAPSRRSDNNRPVRAYASHTPKWQRFQVQTTAQAVSKSALNSKSNSKSKSSPHSVESSEKEVVLYQRQYSHVYTDRLAALKDRCWKALNAPDDDNDDSGNCKAVDRILELKEDRLSKVVGTVVVERTNGAGTSDTNFYQNDDDDDEGEDKQLHPEATCRSGDQLYLEDESGRVAIRFGVVDDRGMMHVRKIVDPAMTPPAVPENDDNNYNDNNTPYLLLVSSLLCGDPEVSSMPRDMLVSYLQGHFGGDGDNHHKAPNVARVIVAGSGPGAVDPVMGLREFDLWGLQVTRTAGIPMDILPSATDPTTRNWPQRPLHSSLLPHTLGNTQTQTQTQSQTQSQTQTQTVMARTTPNPYEASIGNQLVLGTDGLNVRDLQKHVLKPPPTENSNSNCPRLLTELEALEQTLRWAHICPSAPNSSAIGMVPSGDPMVMSRRTTSNIYFCGNCEEGFATKLITYGNDNDNDNDNVNGTTRDPPKTRLICIPKFSENGEAVLVNLKTLEAELLRFKASCTNTKHENEARKRSTNMKHDNKAQE
eukprot:jgi/Psemu1/284041/fgenesh1_pg.41_\